MSQTARRLELSQQQNPRFVDPNAAPEKQYEQLMEFVRNPPENSRVMTISPSLASLVLERLNSRNRNKRPARIKRMAAAMASQNWQLTGVPIVFSRAGILLDGQNRLASCQRSGASFRTHVVFGIHDDAFAVIDTNAVRTNPDAMKIHGAVYPEVVAAAVRWLMIYEQDPLNRGLSFANADLINFYQQKVDKDAMDRAVKRAVEVKRPLPPGALAAHFYMFEKINAKATARFASDLAEQRAGGRKLINKLVALRKQNLGRIHETQMNALIIIAWLAYRANKPVEASILRWTENNEYPSFN